MSQYIIEPSKLSGRIQPPPSKSHTLRAILFAALAQGESQINNYLDSPDTHKMIQACRMFGADIDVQATSLRIIGFNGKPHVPDDVIDAGNSGIVLRYIGAIAALLDQHVVLSGDHSIRHNRPLQPLIDGLNGLDVFCVATKNDGRAPLIVKGPLKGGVTQLDGADSQPVSGLLIASCFATADTELHVSNPGEKPWIGLTLDWFDRLGLRYEANDFAYYKIYGQQNIQGFEYTVPSDFSSLAYPLSAALLTNSELVIENVDMNDAQGDKALIEVLQAMGANIFIDHEQKTLTVKPGSKLRGMTIDINHFIDSVTILAVLGCFAEGTTQIKNAAIARRKECDRLHAITTELRKMGAQIEEHDDSLVIHQSALHGADLESHSDHRMVLSLACAAFAAQGPSVIGQIDCVSKTYKDFDVAMRALDLSIECAR